MQWNGTEVGAASWVRNTPIANCASRLAIASSSSATILRIAELAVLGLEHEAGLDAEAVGEVEGHDLVTDLAPGRAGLVAAHARAGRRAARRAGRRIRRRTSSNTNPFAVPRSASSSRAAAIPSFSDTSRISRTTSTISPFTPVRISVFIRASGLSSPSGATSLRTASTALGGSAPGRAPRSSTSHSPSSRRRTSSRAARRAAR